MTRRLGVDAGTVVATMAATIVAIAPAPGESNPDSSDAALVRRASSAAADEILSPTPYMGWNT